MACPEAEGATELSPGFQPWEPSNKRFALLKGREIRVPDEARTYCRAKVRVRNSSDPASAFCSLLVVTGRPFCFGVGTGLLVAFFLPRRSANRARYRARPRYRSLTGG
jgi:hypothetical protein